jgi:hypothetical protein
MSWTLTYTLAVGDQFASATLVSQLCDVHANPIASPSTDDFVYAGGGYFVWTPTFLDDDFRGIAQIYEQTDPSTILLVVPLNFEDARLIRSDIDIEVRSGISPFETIPIPSPLDTSISISTGVR